MKFFTLIPPGTNFDFISKAKYAFFLSTLVIAGSIFLWFSKGSDRYGVDFIGGTELVIKTTGDVDSEQIRQSLEKVGLESVTVQKFDKGVETYSVQPGNEFSLRFRALGEKDDTKSNVESALKGSFGANVEILKAEFVGPSIGKELSRAALIAVSLALLAILIYVSMRFEFAFALGAVAAVFHDIIVCVGFYLLFEKQLSMSTVAAALTIIGYSVNDTIVIFDRVREEIFKRKRFDLPELMNECVNATLSRTILTSSLTFLTVLSLFLFGGGAIGDLSLFLLIGMITGTYSTVYIASPVVILWDKFATSRREARAVKAS
jgi:preprotein translocase subunit SecF